MSHDNAPPEWNRQVTPPSDADAIAGRAACGYKAGSLPAETQGRSTPDGRTIPVDHIVVMMMENRSFDHYFQKLPENGQTDVEVAPPTFSNLDNDGKPVLPFHDTSLCFVDTAHGWDAVHKQFNGGKMDGFFSTNDADHEMMIMGGTMDMVSGRRGMTYYEAADLPFYYWIANQFGIADHYFSSVLGPTWPNRMFMYGATSNGQTANNFERNVPVIFDLLEKRGVDWVIYYTRTPGLGVFVDKYLFYNGSGGSIEHPRFKTIDEFFTDAAAGTLPQVAFVDPDIAHEGVGANDEHPPAVMQVGQNGTSKVVDALIKSPNWPRSAMFITYDEHGGLYDHVPPPKACAPDDVPAKLDPTNVQAGFDNYGIRVPMLVVSPWAKRHFVAHHVYDHTSILRFIEARFVLPALTGRDANAEAPWEMFDFSQPTNPTPGSPPVPAIDQDKLNNCLAIFGKGDQ